MNKPKKGLAKLSLMGGRKKKDSFSVRYSPVKGHYSFNSKKKGVGKRKLFGIIPYISRERTNDSFTVTLKGSPGHNTYDKKKRRIKHNRFLEPRREKVKRRDKPQMGLFNKSMY